VPFSFQPAQTAMPEGPYGPVVRTGVKAGADVIDLAAMISQMESGRKTGGGQR
jgi:hypothetical protein